METDRIEYQRAQRPLRSLGRLVEAVALAERIMSGDSDAYIEAINDTEPFSEIEGLGSELRFGFHGPKVVSARIRGNDESVIRRR